VAEAVRSGFASSGAFVDGVAVGATVSVGVACNLGGDCDLSSLFRQADAALYAAKRAGRNRVELVGPEQGALSEALHATIRTRPHRPDGAAPVKHDAA
jgi:predicted signal transduction protein with EAL and GGDEF domain